MPKSCTGYCSGFWPIRPPARSFHPETQRQRACFVARTNRHLLRPLPAQWDGFAARRSSLFQPVAKASSCDAPGDEFHVPSSICFSLSSISRFHASVAPSSTVVSRLSIRESVSAERASGGSASASRSNSAGWLSTDRFYRSSACALQLQVTARTNRSAIRPWPAAPSTGSCTMPIGSRCLAIR